MHINNKGVSLPELLAYTTITGILSIILFSLINLTIISMTRVEQMNELYVYSNHVLTDIKYEYSMMDGEKKVIDCNSIRASACLEIETSTSTLKLELNKESNIYKFQITTNGETKIYNNNTFFLNFDESYIMIDKDTCAMPICTSAIIKIRLNLGYLNNKETENFDITLSI